jgi:hypothetical protein
MKYAFNIFTCVEIDTDTGKSRVIRQYCTPVSGQGIRKKKPVNLALGQVTEEWI